MGEIAEMMLDGCLCECCGVYIGRGNGFPVRCHACAVESKAERKAQNIARNLVEHAAIKKIACPLCGRKVKAIGMANHYKDSHNNQTNPTKDKP